MADWLQRIEEPQKQVAAKGGSEILREKLYKYTDIENNEKINLMLSTPSMGKIKFTKKKMVTKKPKKITGKWDQCDHL